MWGLSPKTSNAHSSADKERNHNHDANHSRYLACERKGVFVLLMISAGMMGAYTYNLRGGVFCNAQTANVVLMAMAFGKGEWKSGLYYFIPITAYVAGTFLSELLPNPVKKMGLFRWDTYLVGVEIITLMAIGLVPLTVDNRVVQVLINLICSKQYNTFRQAEGIPKATTSCTNHIRQIGVSIAKSIRHKDTSELKRGVSHTIMVLGFFGGGILVTAFCGILGAKTIWLAALPLAVNFLILARADMFTEHDLLNEKPAGH